MESANRTRGIDETCRIQDGNRDRVSASDDDTAPPIEREIKLFVLRLLYRSKIGRLGFSMHAVVLVKLDSTPMVYGS